MKKFKFLDKKKISTLPKSPGVYAFKSNKAILYIGKANNLKERVKTHFQQPGFRDELFTSEVQKIGCIKTESEIEALVLEAALIKKHQPKFNVVWKDDKNYFYAAVSKEDFPRIFITHQPRTKSFVIIEKRSHSYNNKQKNDYVGPFVDGRALKQALKVLRRALPFRSCRLLPKKPCLWEQLDRCYAPCLSPSKDIKKVCQRNARNLIKILQGKKTQALKGLKKEMKKLSQAQEFELAGKIRDQIEALKRVLDHSRVFQLVPPAPSENWSIIEKKLKKVLGLGKKKTKRIEAYDVSNIQGLQATGAMVVFEKGAPSKKWYRKFKVRFRAQPNDVAMLKEVLSRRLKHPQWPLPDLILIDGGKAQLNAAVRCLRPDLKHPLIMALAKRKNELFVEDKKEPLLLKNLPPEISSLILQIRDEAHRFAIKYHKTLRSKALLS